jgi:hypothetical protein
MPLGLHSARYKHKCVNEIKHLWLKNPEKPVRACEPLFIEYLENIHIPYEMKLRFEKDLADFMVGFLIERYNTWLEHKLITIRKLEVFIDNQFIDDVYHRMRSMIDIWNITYKGPVPKLRDISADSQSVHTSVVVKGTNNGILLLSKVDVDKGQKTLAEIMGAWALKPVLQKMAVYKDMKDWGSRPAVMSNKENVYRMVLRGLWAKIKGISDLGTRSELIERLWQECNESLGLCADGHVARLVNVMVGFDEAFTNNLSPMEYFQHNISLIAASNVPLKQKIEQAHLLMDDINMEIGKRAVWIDAL